ncbi:hypothetical protein J6590_046333 [Homalodisca vitripennis]|nr:hypothetical protein J6590_046333 [Homalodisca vitripennis]
MKHRVPIGATNSLQDSTIRLGIEYFLMEINAAIVNFVDNDVRPVYQSTKRNVYFRNQYGSHVVNNGLIVTNDGQQFRTSILDFNRRQFSAHR